MRTRTYLSLLSLGATVSALSASAALAQSGRTLLICRDGARVIARDNRGCDGHRGIDVGATRALRLGAIRPDARYSDGRYPDGRYPEGRYSDRRYPDARYADHRRDDARRADGWNGDPRRADPRYVAGDRDRVEAHRSDRDQNGHRDHDDHRDGDRRP